MDMSNDEIPSDLEFTRTRKSWRVDMAESKLLRKKRRVIKTDGITEGNIIYFNKIFIRIVRKNSIKN